MSEDSSIQPNHVNGKETEIVSAVVPKKPWLVNTQFKKGNPGGPGRPRLTFQQRRWADFRNVLQRGAFRDVITNLIEMARGDGKQAVAAAKLLCELALPKEVTTAVQINLNTHPVLHEEPEDIGSSLDEVHKEAM